MLFYYFSNYYYMKKTVILYAYYENNNKPKCIFNLKYFLENGLIEDERYSFYININGESKIDFEPYLKKFKNLKILKANGLCGWDGWCNIINNICISNYAYYIFIKDCVLGPYNKDRFKQKNWIEEYVQNIGKNQEIIISGYGVSPLGKLYRLPYVPEKFFCTSKFVVKKMKNNDIFNKFHYNAVEHEGLRVINSQKKYKIDIEKGKDINIPLDASTDIKLTHFLLDNNLNYVSYDIRGIIDLNILKHYNDKNWSKLFELTKEIYSLGDKRIPDRIFWTNGGFNKIMKDESSRNNFINTRGTRNVDELKKW